MRLVEALLAVRDMASEGGDPIRVALVCGFTPLHLQTFLTASLRALDPGHRIAIQPGLYGDCLGNLERLRGVPLDAAALALEWSDLDPRLGLRSLGGWRPEDLADILSTVRTQLGRLRGAIEGLAGDVPLAVCPPTLPLPPVSHTSGWQSGPVVLRLGEAIGGFTAQVGELPGVRIVNAQWLDRISPPGDRLDVKSELLSGFPYKVAHASAVAEALALLIRPPQPKKGLITDLDDTLWHGLLGEVGTAGISWNLDQQSHPHGLYQRLLSSLAGAGVLVAVASKNDPDLVAEAFEREDLILKPASVFPLEVHWSPKSESVGRILQAWNVGADSVVFVDDSPIELAEVKAAFPGIECIAFPKQDEQAVYDLIVRLRDLFGKTALSREDALRLDGIRAASGARAEAGGVSGGMPPDEFLHQLQSELTVGFGKRPVDPRALELVNKTNQFNLNGRRYTEGAWAARLKDPEVFLLRAAYRDKFGPLGTIGVMTGRVRGASVSVDAWVMSCRAFSRLIEHQCVSSVFETFGAEEIVFDYEPTPRNGPLRDFLAAFSPPGQGFRLSKSRFAEKCPALFHQVKNWNDG